jgi:hypothetical protein
VAFRAQEIIVLADAHMQIVLRANDLAPHRSGVGLAPVVPGHGPRTRQGVIDHRNLVVQDIRIALVEKEAFLDDGLVVAMQRQAAFIEGPLP